MVTYKNYLNICLFLLCTIVLTACSSDSGGDGGNASAPAAPTNLTASVSGGSVSLSWDAVDGASSYKVYRDGSLLNSVSSNSFSESGLAYGTYLYEVASVNDSGESASKTSISADVHEVAPSAPSDLSASVSGDSVSLSWSAANGASSYKVYRDGDLVESVSTNSFSENELDDGTYLYEVTSVNDYGESDSKASVSVTVDTSPPAAPTNLTASVSGNSVNLSWSSVSRASSYNIYRNGSHLDTISDTSFSDSDLNYDDTYLYEVASVNEFGESADKASITVVVSTEPLYAHQWHLVNTGQSAFASNMGVIGEDINHSGAMSLGLTGKGVRVNVIDSGLELQHPDLHANIVAEGSYDYVGNDNDPTNNYEDEGDHGTSVAGLIAAVGDNGTGISGVAGNAQLQGYNFLVDVKQQTTANYILAHGLDDKLTDTDIFNKSLGLITFTYDRRLSDDTLETLSCLTSGGDFDNSSTCTGALRDSLGAIYVKSAGNDFNPDSDEASNYICDNLGLTCVNANMEPEHTYPYQIVVGALNADGKKSSYSTAGSAIWVSAPGGEGGYDYNYLDSELNEHGESYTPSDTTDIFWQPAMVTTDQVGCSRGYTTLKVDFEISGVPPIGLTSFHENESLNSNCEYISIMNGTSSAAPVVSGVVALMLEANPSLSWRDVKHILAQSARQVDTDIAALSIPAIHCINCDGYAYIYYSFISFNARDAWITNDAGYKYHNWYGFGAVNAGVAVSLAKNYSEDLGSWAKKSYTSNTEPSTSIPDTTGVPAILTFQINASDNLITESVQLDLEITHSDIRSLAVVLNSPASTRSVLLTPFNVFDNADIDSTLISNAFYGESSTGDWVLEVYDLLDGDTGTINNATLNVYGH